MKQFIVLAACLPILLVFLVQFSLDQTNMIRMELIEDYVMSAKEAAKQEGCFSEDIKRALRNNITSSLGISESEIVIITEDTPIYRVNSKGERGLIYYEISFPIGTIMSGKRLFGIKDDDNILYYSVKSYVPSELLP